MVLGVSSLGLRGVVSEDAENGQRISSCAGIYFFVVGEMRCAFALARALILKSASLARPVLMRLARRWRKLRAPLATNFFSAHAARKYFALRCGAMICPRVRRCHDAPQRPPALVSACERPLPTMTPHRATCAAPHFARCGVLHIFPFLRCDDPGASVATRSRNGLPARRALARR